MDVKVAKGQEVGKLRVIRLPRKDEKLEAVPGMPGFYRRPGEPVSFRLPTNSSLLVAEPEITPPSLGLTEATGFQTACTCHSNGHSTSTQASRPASERKSQSL